MNTIYWFTLAALLSFNFSLHAAEDLEASSAVSVAQKEKIAPPVNRPTRFKAGIDSYFYDFEGTRAANGDLYDFGNSTMYMQLLTLQYQISPKLTLMVIGQYLDTYIETNMFGNLYKDRTKGFGDTILSGITPLVMNGKFMLFADIGVSLPTGSIDERNKDNKAMNYAYNMQLGSGTFDGVIGLTPLYFGGAYNLGARLSSFLRTGVNENGYMLGNLYRLDAWADYPTKIGLVPRLVGYYKHKDSLRGQDSTLGRTALTEYYHHAQINWDISAALRYQKALGPVAFWAEVGVPVAQDMRNSDNVVVSTDYYGALSVTGAF